MAIYKNTPPIVTSGLVLNLDSLNPQSIPLAPTINNVRSQSTYFTTFQGASTITATYSESAWYVTFKSGSTAVNYKGLYATKNPNFVLEPTSSRVTYSFKIQAVTKNVSMSIDLNNAPYSGSSTSNDHRIFAQDVYFPAGTFLVTTSSVINAYAQYTVQTGSANFTGSYYYTFNSMYLQNGFVVDQDLTVKIWDIQHELSNWQTPFTPTSRSIWYDLSGNNNHATLLGNARPIPQYPSSTDKTLFFDGTGSYAQTTTILTGSAYTAEFFFNATSLRPGVEKWLGSQYNFGANRIVFDIFTDNRLRNFMGNGTNPSSTAVTSTTVVQLNRWYHAVFSKDTLGTGSLYVNGVLEGRGAMSLGTPENVPFQIGGDTALPVWFNGRIPITRLYNRALSQAEVTQNYNAIKSRFGL
jgi:hypothetical protein